MKFPQPHDDSKVIEYSRVLKSAIKKPRKDTKVPDLHNFKAPISAVPEWFLDNCVLTAKELADSEIPLVVRDKLPTESDDAQVSDSSDAEVYDVETVVYERLLDLISSPRGNGTDGQDTKSKKSKVFSKDAIYLRFPGKHGAKGGVPFLTSVVHRFARDAKADLITLSLDDLDDLLHDLTGFDVELIVKEGREQVDKKSTEKDATKKKSKSNETSPEDAEDPFRASIKDEVPTSFPFSTLLSSPNIKRSKGNPEASQSDKQKFLTDMVSAIKEHSADIIIITTTDQASEAPDLSGCMHDCYDDYDYGSYDYNDDDLDDYNSGNIFTRCWNLIRHRRALADDEYSLPPLRRPRCAPWLYSLQSEVLDVIGKSSKTQVINMAPVQSRTQRVLLEKHRKLEESHERVNIRSLQRSIRQNSPKNCKLPLVQPFAEWPFLEGTPAKKKLTKDKLSGKEVSELVEVINRGVGEEHIKQIVLRMGRREEALDFWRDNKEDEAWESKWAAFPAKIQSVIEKVQKDEDELIWEKRFLPLLINPDEIEEGWDDIALHPDSKDAIMQLTPQSSKADVQHYGILKRGRIGGALLYGPPGTGKTHLARVLARESKAIMISASAAELVSMWVGETEKAIKGLFNLARMLSPCTLFIDEADALYRRRMSEDPEWQRSQLNQLLLEMDGLKKSKTPPFVLLATNYPSELDHAVLRRVPGRIHIGLPSTDARRRIWEICLADETLEEEVKLEKLVSKSRGYSGSDIQTVCIQAALICDTFTDDKKEEVEESNGKQNGKGDNGDSSGEAGGGGGGSGRKRLLELSHFEKAFQRSRPTVSKTALSEIKTFAKDFDPQALERMTAEDHEGVDGLESVKHIYL